MPAIPIRRADGAQEDSLYVKEIFDRIERLQRRIEAIASELRAGEGELRRQRAAGRRP